MTKPEGAKNGKRHPEDVVVCGSVLSQDAISILLSLTPEEIRGVARRLRQTCLYNGKDEAASMRGAAKFIRAAEAT